MTLFTYLGMPSGVRVALPSKGSNILCSKNTIYITLSRELYLMSAAWGSPPPPPTCFFSTTTPDLCGYHGSCPPAASFASLTLCPRCLEASITTTSSHATAAPRPWGILVGPVGPQPGNAPGDLAGPRVSAT